MLEASQPHQPTPEEVALQVRELLPQAPAFRALPADTQQRMMTNLGKVMSFLTDPAAGDPSLREVARRYDQARLAEAQAATPGAVTPAAPGAGVKAFKASQPKEHGVAKAVTQFDRLVKTVDFPEFVSGLIEGVFTSIVDSSIRQMEAYSKMLEAVVKSVDDFATENFNDDDARDYMQESFPNALQITSDDSGPLLAMKDGFDSGGMPDFSAFLGTPAPQQIDDRDSEAELLRQAKLKMARGKQQQLATMVLLGINRIVVTNGRINAKVVFDVDATESMSSSASAHATDTRSRTGTYSSDSGSSGSGSYDSSWDSSGDSDDRKWSNKGSGKGSSSWNRSRKYSSVNTRVSTLERDTSRQSNEEINAKAQLTGEVSLNFKSETFPLERIADQGGLALLQDRARPQALAPVPSAPGQAAPAPAPPAASRS
ncbi:MAG: hypothetical protein ABIO70_16000 [Pseudomonadota bacterium]